ncbi:MAG TPA: hypothetical protein VJ418_12570 [Streptosporangiaceae bacterium]|jgi:hypothetical protein|nr:hypothetical protein [Streptosporangiaceae bacterium]
MTETISPPETPAAEIPPTSPSPFPARPHTDAAALRAIDEATKHLHERAVKIRECPEVHMPKLVLSEHVRGTSILAKVDAEPASS